MLIVITGPSGVGKTTIMEALMGADPSLKYSISITTRPPRDNEKHGVDYYFVANDDFRQMIEKNELVEWSEVYGKYYGRSKKGLDELSKQYDTLIGIDIQGAIKLQKIYPDAVFIFILPKSEKALERQLRGRGTESEQSIKTRLNISLDEMSKADNFDYKVVNDIVEEAVKKIQAIIIAEKCRSNKKGTQK